MLIRASVKAAYSFEYLTKELKAYRNQDGSPETCKLSYFATCRFKGSTLPALASPTQGQKSRIRHFILYAATLLTFSFKSLQTLSRLSTSSEPQLYYTDTSFDSIRSG